MHKGQLRALKKSVTSAKTIKKITFNNVKRSDLDLTRLTEEEDKYRKNFYQIDCKTMLLNESFKEGVFFEAFTMPENVDSLELNFKFYLKLNENSAFKRMYYKQKISGKVELKVKEYVKKLIRDSNKNLSIV